MLYISPNNAAKIFRFCMEVLYHKAKFQYV
jgi:hypothetical protein